MFTGLEAAITVFVLFMLRLLIPAALFLGISYLLKRQPARR